MPARPLGAADAPARLAYADPPYLGCCGLYDHYHPDGLCWDHISTHAALIQRLEHDYDGYALSATSQSLFDLLPLFEERPRIGSWVKTFAAFKRNVRVAYTWEPMIFRPGRDSSPLGAAVTRDHLAEPITMKKGFTGAKPERVCRWVLDLLGWKPGDQVDDLYPGTDVMGRVIAAAQGLQTEHNGQPSFDFGEVT